MSEWNMSECGCEPFNLHHNNFVVSYDKHWISHSQKNQLFIDSLNHWLVDGVHMFESGHTITKTNKWVDMWDNSKIEIKLTGFYCPMCEVFKDDHSACFLEHLDLDVCCSTYDCFADDPCLETCNAVVTYLWDRSQQVCHRDYQIKMTWDEYIKWRNECVTIS